MQFTSLLILHGVLQEWICISMHFQFASSLIMIYVHKEFPQFSRQIEGVKWIDCLLSFGNLTRKLGKFFFLNFLVKLKMNQSLFLSFGNLTRKLRKLKVWNESMFVFVIRWFDEIFLMCHCLLIVHKEWYNRQWHCQWQWNIILDWIQKRKKTSWRIRINDVVLRF